jgi:hypothetical protein
MKKLYLLYTLSLLIFVFSCSKDNETNNPECGKPIIIDKSQYMNIDAINAAYIDSLSIEGNCLTAIIGYSGCNDGHDMDLITAGEVAESFPVMIALKFRDNEPQACQAFFIQKYTFDLNPLLEIIPSEGKARLFFLQDNSEILWTID